MVFRNEFFFLSNFYSVTLHDIDFPEITYSSVEAAFQAAKTLNQEERRRFSSIAPGDAKRLGRRVTLRPDWETIKVSVMEAYLRQKFADTQLARRLAAVQEPIVEENTWGDRYWGVCRGTGRNELGKLLEKIKKEI